MARITVWTFGTLKIEVGDRSLGPSAGQLFAALFYLASRGDHPTSRALLAEMLLPQTNETQPGHNLRQLIYRLRQLGVRLHTDAGGVKLAEDVRLDWLEMLQQKELGAPDFELIAKGFCPGYTPDVSEAFREWYEAERSSVQLRLSRAVGLQLTQLRHAGRWDLVEVGARAMLALDPFNEKGMTSRAEALAASGSTKAALRVIDDYVDELGEDQANLRLRPMALRRRISEQLPDMGHRTQEDRIFVGREDAMRMLSAAGAAARRGTQQTVLVWGEPGIGKTRLLAEYKALAALEGALTVQATCQPHDVFRPLGILSDLLTQLLEAPGALGCDPERRKLLSRLVAATEGNTAALLPGESSLPAIISSLNDLLAAISSECALVILLDDAHWADRASLTALVTAFSSKTIRPCWFVMASRDRALLQIDNGLAATLASVRLDPLDHRTALDLAKSILGSNKLDEAVLEEQLLREGGGNPFFIRLLCRHIVSAGDELQWRQTIAGVLERRLDQLSLHATRALEAAVVLGKHCTYARLAAILEVNRFALLRAIEELDDRGLIEVRDGCFLSSHALLAEAVVRRMSNSVKCLLHSAAAKLLQNEFEPAEGGSLPWDCAEHWKEAGNHREAVTALRDCANRALEVGRPTDAFETLKRALMLDAPDALRLEILELALATLWLGVNWSEGSSLFAERRHIRARLGLPENPHDIYETLEYAASYHTAWGDLRKNVKGLRRCVTAEAATGRHKLAAARLLLTIAELTLDSELANFAYRHSRSLEDGSRRQLLCDLLYHTCFGSPQAAAIVAGNLVKSATGDHASSAVWLLNAAYGLYRIGNPETAEDAMVQGLESARKCRSRSNEMHACLLLARLYWSTERFTDCELWHARFLKLTESHDDPNVIGEHSVLGARIALHNGDADLARAYISRARECAQANLDLPQLFIAACEIDLQLATSVTESFDNIVADALLVFPRARGLGCQDDVALSLAKALMALGREMEAKSLLEDYLMKCRRDSFSAPNAMMKLSTELGIGRASQTSAL